MDKLIEMISSGEPYYLLVAILIVTVFHLEKITTFIEKQKRKEVEAIKRSMAVFEGQNEIINFLKNQLEISEFKHATGIYADKNKRDALIKLYNKINKDFTLHKIRHASPLLFEDEGRILVKIKLVEHIAYYYHFSAGVYILCCGFLSLLAIIFINFSSIKAITILFLLFLSLLALAVFILRETLPVAYARKIKKAITKGL